MENLFLSINAVVLRLDVIANPSPKVYIHKANILLSITNNILKFLGYENWSTYLRGSSYFLAVTFWGLDRGLLQDHEHRDFRYETNFFRTVQFPSKLLTSWLIPPKPLTPTVLRSCRPQFKTSFFLNGREYSPE